MYAWRVVTARAGGSPCHSSSIMRSTGTTRPPAATSSASTARCRGPPSAARTPDTSASNVPNTRIRTMSG
nr:hypothetical protein [Actinomadura sp. CNU-125]